MISCSTDLLIDYLADLDGINFKFEAQYQKCQTGEVAQISYAFKRPHTFIVSAATILVKPGEIGEFCVYLRSGGEKFFKRIRANQGSCK